MYNNKCQTLMTKVSHFVNVAEIASQNFIFAKFRFIDNKKKFEKIDNKQ